MSSKHVEVLERLRGVLEHGKMGDKCLIAPDLVTAAIAALSAPRPPAEAQPVAAAPGGLLPCPFCGADSADTGGLLPWVECTDCDASGPSCGTEEEAVAAWNRRTQPPSAPVGVEAKDAEIEALRVRADAMAGEAIKHEARAERLAEALRGLLALPIAEAELRHLDKGIGTATRNAAWLRARAALRDHDQEGGNP